MRLKRATQAGFTLLELGVAITAIAVLAVLLLNRLHIYQEMAEKAAMESTLRLIKTGLQIRLAELIITNRQGEAQALETEDPTRWLEPLPPNYAGAYLPRPQPGNWYFDAQRRELVYVVIAGRRLQFDAGADGNELRFRTRLVKDRLRIGGGSVDAVTGVTLAPVTRFRWSRGRLTTRLT